MDLKVDANGGRAGRLMVQTEGMDPDEYTYTTVAQIGLLQRSAKEKGVEKFMRRKDELRELEKMASEVNSEGGPTLGAIEASFQLRYASAVAEKVTRELMNPEEEDIPKKYLVACEDFQKWAAGNDLERAERIFPGWKGTDFVSMLRVFDKAEEDLRKKIEEDFRKKGVDLAATRELIRQADEAQRKLESAAEYIRNINGVFPNDRNS